uniref:DDE-1 domain-containing protein n=1 Tax=Graphocephala atropunctata TaxID=36148 RepID=A0A1B6KPH3_9HEMI
MATLQYSSYRQTLQDCCNQWTVIEIINRHYRKQFLRKLLVEGKEKGVLANHKKLNLKDCPYMVAEAWSLVKAVILRCAWNKLKGMSTEEEKKKQTNEKKAQKKEREETEDEDDLSLEELRKILLCSEDSAEDVGERMVCDSSDPGFQILNDDELIESVSEESLKEEDDINVKVEADTGPSAS